jgi:hypothetical protein
VFIMLILASGAPGAEPSVGRALHNLQSLSIGEAFLITLALVILALLLDPLQLRLVRLLEGNWPSNAGQVSRWSVERQCRRRARKENGARLSENPSAEEIQKAGARDAQLLQRFPANTRDIRATALGNVLAAAESQAGLAYGWDAAVAWPRLYPLLSPSVRTIVDGQRDRLDALSRLSVTAGTTAFLSLALLCTSGWWVLLAAVPIIVSRVAYDGTVHTAIAYGESMKIAFDLNRFDLLRTLHLPLPPDLAQERKIADEVSLMWRQGVDFTTNYEHGSYPGS